MAALRLVYLPLVSTSPSPRREVAGQVLWLAGPAVLTSMMQTVVFLADRIMLAQHSEESLASMQIQGPVLWSAFSVFLGMVVGTVALVSRAVGRGDVERARTVTRAALRLALVLGLLVGVLGFLGTPWIVLAMAPDSVAIRAASTGYMRVAFPAFPAAFVATAAAMSLHGAGDTRTPFRVGLIANVVNIGLNALFIFGYAPLGIPELGAAGAAIGTAGAFHVQILLYAFVLTRPDRPVGIVGIAKTRTDPGDIQARRDVIRLSTPALLERLVIHLGFVLFAAAITSLGPTAMAANQAMITLESICFLGAEGFGVAAATVVGQFLGREQPERSTMGGWIATALGAASLTAFGALIWSTSPWTLLAFRGEGASGDAMMSLALSTMPLLALAQPLMGASVVLGHALRGAGDTRSPVIAAAVGGLCVRVGGAWLLAVQLDVGLRGIWMVTTLDWGLRFLILGTIFARGRWKSIRV
jgi:putative MATE family efflux protein